MQKYLPDKTFLNFIPTKKVFTEQVEKILISQWSFSDFRVMQETHAFELKAVYNIGTA